MKKLIVFCAVLSFFLLNSYSQNSGEDAAVETTVSTAEEVPVSAADEQGLGQPDIEKSASAATSSEPTSFFDSDELHKPGVSDVPEAKRPKEQDKDKIAELDANDKDGRKEHSETLRYGMEDDIYELIDKLVKDEDVRFVDDVYDLFQETKNPSVREKILEYFTKLEDPCLEDYAVMVLNDPYEEKNSTVNAVFRYVQAVKTKQAIPAVLTLIENEEEDYFNGALTTIGEIGGPKEALYLSEYIDREDLSVGQKQQLVKVLGKIKAVETYDKLVELAEDEDENTFIRMYSAESIGAMEKKEAVPVLVKLYEDPDPKLRSYVIKGLAHFKDDEEAKKLIIQAVRDTHVSVRLEAIEACRANGYKEAVPYMIYRLEKDKEDSVKKKCFPAIAELNTDEGNKYLVKQITDKKVADTPKSRAASALLEFNNAGTDEILALARETLKDDRRKALRYALGKEFTKYKRDEFAPVCREYIQSKDTSTQGTGLDIYSKGRYPDVTQDVRDLVISAAKDTGKKNANAKKAERILGSDDNAVKEAEKIRDEEEAKKEAKINALKKPAVKTDSSNAK